MKWSASGNGALPLVVWVLLIGTARAEKLEPAFENAHNLFRLTDTCNVYVLRSGEAALLVNVGDGKVFEHLADIGVQHVEQVLLTDHHRESCQGLLRNQTMPFNTATSAAEAEILKAPASFRHWFPKLGDQYTVYGASYVRPSAQPIDVTRELELGETFTWRDFEIKCLSTPGTSPGGLSFVVMYEGRTIAFTGSVIHDGPTMTNWFDSEWDYGFAKGVDTLIESVEKLRGESIDVILPSQGPVILNAKDQLATYQQKLTKFRASYVRGYPVFDKAVELRDPISTPTPIPHINQVTPHLYKLSHEHQGRNFAIIISDSGHGLILDAGLFPRAVLEEIIVGLREHMGLKEIDAFWISHMHCDHFLLGPALKEFGAEAWTLKSIVDRCEHPRRYDYAALVSAYGDGFDGMQIEKAFEDGETVEWEGYTIHVDWMPGQTEFHCCLWLELDGKKIAFTGDNLFGSPSDPAQNGHEAVVCRNSAILEEGYVRGSKYLMDLKPDIVMGSHSYVMPEPQAFLQRYHAWSKEMVALYKDLLPEKDYEYLFDPYWVSAYPYRVDLSEAAEQEVEITIRNFRSTEQQHEVALVLPEGVTATPAVLEGSVPPESRKSFKVMLRRDASPKASGLQIVPFDITLDGKHYGQLFDFLVLLPEAAAE